MINKKSIKADIDAGSTAFDAQQYFVSGEDYGKAGALLVFGRAVGDKVSLTDNEYNAAVMLTGYAATFGASDKIKSKIYGAASKYGDIVMEGLEKALSGRNMTTSSDSAYLLH